MNKQYINSCMRWVINELAPSYINGNFTPEMSSKMSTFYDCIGNSLDWFNLTMSDVKSLGFLNCSESQEEELTSIWFIPVWLMPVIPEGITLWDRNGNPFIYKRQSCCKDVMYGCLTFGVILGGETYDDRYFL